MVPACSRAPRRVGEKYRIYRLAGEKRETEAEVASKEDSVLEE